ncbi:MAG: class I SAM-dependent methyltransferase [Candidatus Thorarchaeota archaeon]
MEYWNNRFLDKGEIWGNEPSKTAVYALNLFKKYNLKKILIPGAGYGRHTKFFSSNNYEVTGIEISEVAVSIAKENDINSKYILGSVLDMPYNKEIYDAVFCHNLLHLLLEEQRISFIRKCYNQLRYNGFAFFSVFSEQEQSFGKGTIIEKNTFESKPYKPTHYFTERDIKKHFDAFSIIETNIIEEKENHGELGPHTHKLRYIFVKKEKKI